MSGLDSLAQSFTLDHETLSEFVECPLVVLWIFLLAAATLIAAQGVIQRAAAMFDHPLNPHEILDYLAQSR
ncbi:MAG: hypothetical protein WEA04_04685 [Candidatus Andersenbacteria bacterium]